MLFFSAVQYLGASDATHTAYCIGHNVLEYHVWERGARTTNALRNQVGGKILNHLRKESGVDRL